MTNRKTPGLERNLSNSMSKWTHRVEKATESEVLCSHCGWVARTDKGGRPMCSVARRERRGSKGGSTRHKRFIGDVCEMCGAVERLVVDHDHACCSGKHGCDECMRGTLCHSCNIELGYIERARKRGTLDGLLAW